MEFHPHFATQHAGDVILQADDVETPYFYYRLSRLAELSTFFADLPPPSPNDLIGDNPIIKLPDTTSASLSIFLHAIDSLTKITTSIQGSGTSEPVIKAALIGDRYDLPVIYRLLVENEENRPVLPPGHSLGTIFALWALSGADRRIATAATATALTSFFDITQTPKHTIEILQQYAPLCWSKLQALHLRRASAPYRFIRECNLSVSLCCCEKCGKAGVNLDQDIRDRVRKARNTAEMKVLIRSGYGVGCASCGMEVVRACENETTWFVRFTEELDFVMSCSEYLQSIRH